MHLGEVGVVALRLLAAGIDMGWGPCLAFCTMAHFISSAPLKVFARRSIIPGDPIQATSQLLMLSPWFGALGWGLKMVLEGNRAMTGVEAKLNWWQYALSPVAQFGMGSLPRSVCDFRWMRR